MDTPTGNGIVQVAYLHGDHVSYSWYDSMKRARAYDQEHITLLAEKDLDMRCGSGVLITQVRNYATRIFLDHTPHEWMLFVDTDMGFDDSAIHDLWYSADPVERPIVGGLCFAVMQTGRDGRGGWRQTIVPTMYKLGLENASGKPSFCHYGPYEYDSMVQVAGTGAAFLLMHRSALERVREKHGDNWWGQLTDHAGDLIGEDIGFCLRAGALGIPVYVNTAVKTTHHKATWVGEDDYLAVHGLTPAAYATPYEDELPVFIDVAASCKALAANEHVQNDMLKLPDDLMRYEAIIKANIPEVIVETGTHRGGSARWFARRGIDVITVDLESRFTDDVQSGEGPGGRVTWIKGDSVDLSIVERVTKLVGDRRCMVVLDSDHSATHVAQEIVLYGPLVTPGCHLVVEDGIFAYGGKELLDQHFPQGLAGSPLDAVAALLVGADAWGRDIGIECLTPVERTSPISSNPAGWWVRRG